MPKEMNAIEFDQTHDQSAAIYDILYVQFIIWYALCLLWYYFS